jgi:hypothetical protein
VSKAIAIGTGVVGESRLVAVVSVRALCLAEPLHNSLREADPERVVVLQ